MYHEVRTYFRQATILLPNISITSSIDSSKVIVFFSPHSRIFYHGGRQKTDSDLQLEVLSITQVRNVSFCSATNQYVVLFYVCGKFYQQVFTFALVGCSVFVHLHCFEYFEQYCRKTRSSCDQPNT